MSVFIAKGLMLAFLASVAVTWAVLKAFEGKDE